MYTTPVKTKLLVRIKRLKRFSIIFSLVSICTFNHAKVNYTFSGAINLTDLKNRWETFDNPEIMPRFGYSAGLGMEIPVKGTFFIRSQINLVAKNYAFNTEDFYGAGTKGYDRYSVLYIDFPLLAGYRYKDFHVFLGPFADYCLGGTNQHKLEYFNGMSDNAKVDIKSSESLRRHLREDEIFPLERQFFLDAGIIMGVGYHNKDYSLDLSHSLGLINIFPKDAENNYRNEFPLFTRVFTLQLNVYL